MMNDQVKYQLEKADFALREALKFGGQSLNPYRLGNIVDALKEIDSAKFAIQYDKTVESTETTIGTTFSDGLDNINSNNNAKWKKLGEMNNTPFLWDNKTEFVPAQPTVSE